MEEAKKRLVTAIPFIKLAINQAAVQEPDAEIQFGVIAKKADGTGVIAGTFNADEFLDDIIVSLGYTDIHDLIAKAEGILNEAENEEK